ncbi:MAG TPA: endonuclease/exonuclease/phosphatase family protein [Candidatus Paceibacterota bacterium]
MRGNKLGDAVLSNLSMHGLRPVLPCGLPRWLRKLTVPARNKYLKNAISLVENFSPDILCLNEVLVDTHGKELEKKLHEMGFTTIIYGVSLHHLPQFRISLVLATKAKAETIPFSLSMENRPGGSGGAGSLFIPSENLAVLGVHLALPGTLLDTELEEVNTWMQNQKKLGRRVLVLGDFNTDKKQIDKKVPALSSFTETAAPTCPSFKTLFKKSDCIDHIFFDESFQNVNSGVEAGYSDHKLVWAELN